MRLPLRWSFSVMAVESALSCMDDQNDSILQSAGRHADVQEVIENAGQARYDENGHKV